MNQGKLILIPNLLGESNYKDAINEKIIIYYILMPKKTRKNKKIKNKTCKKRVFTKKHYNAGDGMLTSVWGPAMWHYLHAMSFNYPVKPSAKEKKD